MATKRAFRPFSLSHHSSTPTGSCYLRHVKNVSRPVAAAWIAALLSLVVSSAIAQQADDGLGPTEAPDDETFIYTVEPDQGCGEIAEKVYGVRRAFPRIHAHNPDLGPRPHRFQVGQRIVLSKIGAIWLPEEPVVSADANLTQIQRQVDTREASEAEWTPGAIGQDLFHNWRVSTHDESSAEITFRNESVVRLNENTLVIINARQDQGPSRRRTYESQLERGTLRSRLGELRMLVNTGSSRTQLAGGESEISVDESGVSRLSHFSGGEATVTGEGDALVEVAPGFGTKVLRGEPPRTPRELPPAPVWKDTNSYRFPAILGHGASVSGEWHEVEEATGYRVEVTRLDGSVVAALELDSDADRTFTVHGVHAGSYDLRVYTIDNDKFISLPETQRVHVLSVRPLGAGSQANGPPTVLVGTSLAAPPGMTCAIGDGDATATVRITTPGAGILRCSDGGTHVADVPFSAITPRLIVTPTDTEDRYQVELMRPESAGNGLTLAGSERTRIDNAVAVGTGQWQVDVEHTDRVDALSFTLADEAGALATGSYQKPAVGPDPRIRLAIGLLATALCLLLLLIAWRAVNSG